MMDFDALDLGFNTLTLRPSATATSKHRDDNTSKFHLYPTLPTELRLKILSHALPRPTALKLTANILIADPEFGLYLVFLLRPPRNPFIMPPGSFGIHEARAPRKWYVEARSLNLLAACKEMRAVYLEKFPYTLPSGKSAPWLEGGLIRYSREDMIIFRNFPSLMAATRVRKAVAEGWRLQDFWTDVRILHVDIQVASSGFIDACVAALAEMTGLKSVRVKLWSGFLENHFETARVQVRRAMDDRVKVLEGMVREVREARKGDVDELVMPTFELMD